MSRARLILGLVAAAAAGAAVGWRAGLEEGRAWGKVDGILWSAGEFARQQVRR